MPPFHPTLCIQTTVRYRDAKYDLLHHVVEPEVYHLNWVTASLVDLRVLLHGRMHSCLCREFAPQISCDLRARDWQMQWM